MSNVFRQVLVGLQTIFVLRLGCAVTGSYGGGGGASFRSLGALVPHAAITITNAGTGFTASLQTSETGTFRFSYLPVGSYKLRVSAKGFAAFDANGIRVDVNRVVNLPLSLTLAGNKGHRGHQRSGGYTRCEFHAGECRDGA